MLDTGLLQRGANLVELLLGLDGVVTVELAATAVRVDDHQPHVAELGLLGGAAERGTPLGLGHVAHDDGPH